MRTKGVGPRGLGVTPFKQTKKQQSIMQNEDGSAYTEEQAKTEHIKRLTQNIQDVPVESTMRGSAVGAGLIGGGSQALAKLSARIAGGLAKSPRTAKLADKILNVSRRTHKNTSGNKKALEAFKKASPKDPTKTTRLSNYNR